MGNLALRLTILVNTGEIQQQQLPQSQIWPKRQKSPQILVGPISMKEIERTNVVVILKITTIQIR